MNQATQPSAVEALRKKLSNPTNKGGAQAEIEYSNFYRTHGGQTLKRKYTGG